MSGVKHTPWEDVETESSVDVEGCTGWQDIADQSGRTVAIVIGWGGWTDRDLDRRVSLIAAAPDLLEALVGLVDRDLTYDGPCIVIPAKSHVDAISIVRRARNAIARARGEQDGGGHV